MLSICSTCNGTGIDPLTSSYCEDCAGEGIIDEIDPEEEEPC